MVVVRMNNNLEVELKQYTRKVMYENEIAIISKTYFILLILLCNY